MMCGQMFASPRLVSSAPSPDPGKAGWLAALRAAVSSRLIMAQISRDRGATITSVAAPRFHTAAASSRGGHGAMLLKTPVPRTGVAFIVINLFNPEEKMS